MWQGAEGDRHSHDRFVYVNTSKQVGDPDHIKVFATADAAATWFAENDLKALPSSMRFWDEGGCE